MAENGKFDLKVNIEINRDWQEMRERDRSLWDAMGKVFKAISPKREIDLNIFDDPGKQFEYCYEICTMISHLPECTNAWDVLDLVCALWDLWFDKNLKLKDGQGEDIAVFVWMFWTKRRDELARLVIKESASLFQAQCML